MKLPLIIVLIGSMLVAADLGEELQIAARRGQLTEVRKLLDAGAPLEIKNQYGATPLYLAVFNGHTGVALLLLEKGANANVTDTFYKSSILDSALQKDRPEIVRALIAKGVPVSARQLNMAVGFAEAPTIEAVLTAKFKPEELGAALRAAIAAKKPEAEALLRKAGAVEPKTISVSPELLAGYAGDFASTALPLAIRVTAEGTSLKAQADGQQQFPLTAESDTAFVFDAAGIRMVFDGKDKFTLHQGGREFPYTRKK